MSVLLSKLTYTWRDKGKNQIMPTLYLIFLGRLTQYLRLRGTQYEYSDFWSWSLIVVLMVFGCCCCCCPKRDLLPASLEKQLCHKIHYNNLRGKKHNNNKERKWAIEDQQKPVNKPKPGHRNSIKIRNPTDT